MLGFFFNLLQILFHIYFGLIVCFFLIFVVFFFVFFHILCNIIMFYFYNFTIWYDISLTCNVTIWIRTCPIMTFVIPADITSEKHNSSPFETVEVIFVKWISMIVTLFSLRQERTLHIFSNIFMFYFFMCLLLTTSKLNLESFLHR